MSTQSLSEKDALFHYCLRLGDTALILAQRLSEWCGHAPILEEDIALSNISLDQIGQARILLTYAGELEGKGRSEDDLAYFRDTRQYYNLLLVEVPNGDFARTITREFLVSTFMFHQYTLLSKSTDKTLAAFANKSVKEVAYHYRHSHDWMLRLGDGTEESHQRMQQALNELWLFTDDMFQSDAVDELLVKKGITPDPAQLKELWENQVQETLKKATLVKPEVNNFMRTGSRFGNHTEHLGYVLAEMQFLPRAYPDAKW